MAQISVEAPVLSMRGKISQLSRIIYRQKTYSVGSHHYLGPIEAYVVMRPRDRRKDPPSPAEQGTVDRFRKACNETKKQLADPERRAYWVQRFEYQLDHPEPAYGKNRRVGETRVFLQLHLYVRTMLLRQYTQEAKSAESKSTEQPVNQEETKETNQVEFQSANQTETTSQPTEKNENKTTETSEITTTSAAKADETSKMPTTSAAKTTEITETPKTELTAKQTASPTPTEPRAGDIELQE